jgi:flavin-dependent dehydrogenase
VFGNSGWECPQILDALDVANELYFDRVSQVRMGTSSGSWTHGRVTLIGDSAFCVSFLAGQGSALAMVAAYILAGELYRAGADYPAAFAQYQKRFEPFCPEEAESSVTLCGYVCTEVKVLDALAQSDHGDARTTSEKWKTHT